MEARDAHEDVAARTIEYEVVDEEPPQAREIHYGGRDVDGGFVRRITHEGEAEYAYRSRYGAERKDPYYRERSKNRPCARSACRLKQRGNASSFPITCRPRLRRKRGQSTIFEGSAFGRMSPRSCVT